MRVTYLSEAAKARERRKKERKLSIRPSADETEGGGGWRGKGGKVPDHDLWTELGGCAAVAAAVRKAETLAETSVRARREGFCGDGVFYGTRLATA